MHTENPATVLGSFVSTLIAVLFARAGDDRGRDDQGASPGPGRQADPYPGCVKIFDGKTFGGWEADPSTWSLKDGTMRGFGDRSKLAYMSADPGSFCLILSAGRP
jgi:hypothetical protein